jgi:hypothetical protein
MKARIWALHSSGTGFCVCAVKDFCEKGYDILSPACPTDFHLPILYVLYINLLMYKNLLCDFSLRYLFLSTDIHSGNVVKC